MKQGHKVAGNSILTTWLANVCNCGLVSLDCCACFPSEAFFVLTVDFGLGDDTSHPIFHRKVKWSRERGFRD